MWAFLWAFVWASFLHYQRKDAISVSYLRSLHLCDVACVPDNTSHARRSIGSWWRTRVV